MRSRILLTSLLTALFVLMSGCGGVPNCPVCGTTQNGSYGVIDIVTVPEHNPTGEPGGPFNSFDISTIAPNPAASGHYLDYVSDRIGLAMVVVDTSTNIAVNAIQGSNAVTDAGNGASPCDPSIPPTIDVFGNFTRFGCRNPPFHLGSGFGGNGNFGGFPGAQCCAARANGVNPMSGPDGNTTTPDGKFLFVGNGSSSVVVFDLTTMNLSTNPPTPPTVIANIPTGISADYDGPQGISGCIASWNGEAGSAADCGDDRADEMAYDPTHQILSVINGDPGLPFVTYIDMSHIIAKNPADSLQLQHCLPIDITSPYGPYAAASQISGDPTDFPTYPSQGFSGTWVIPQGGSSFNPPSCILGQIYYDGVGGPGSPLTANTPVDTLGGNVPCPDPSNPQVFSGVSGSSADAGLLPGVGTTPSGASYTIPCHHGPLLNYSNPTLPLGAFCQQSPTPQAGCAGAIAPAGLGGMAYDPNSGMFLQTNENSIGVTNIGSVDVIDMQLGTGNGPVVVNSFPLPDCMPTGLSQGPGDNFLVGCADHDGEAFPPNEYVINGTTGQILATIYNVGGVDETWYNPGDNRYYLAARDMPTGAVMGIIDAGSNLWLENVATGSNSHSVAVDPSTNHAFVPLQAGAQCTTQSANGCIGVYAKQ
ncbi:MAG: hypothetical protein WA172_07105 [Terriglobales bacterium]